MNKTATVHARVDQETKELSEGVLRRIGMSPTDAVRLLYRQIAMRGEFPVELRVPNELTAKTLDQSDKDIDVESFDGLEALRASWIES
jgi:DNA-damage-inducible protein J